MNKKIGIIAGAAAAGMALVGVGSSMATATEPDGVETIQITVYDTSPTEQVVNPNLSNWHYNPVAECPEGYVATGGGWADNTVNVGLTQPIAGNDGPTTDGLGWQGHGFYYLGTRTDIGVTVICALGTTS